VDLERFPRTLIVRFLLNREVQLFRAVDAGNPGDSAGMTVGQRMSQRVDRLEPDLGIPKESSELGNKKLDNPVGIWKDAVGICNGEYKRYLGLSPVYDRIYLRELYTFCDLNSLRGRLISPHRESSPHARFSNSFP
jgi:hypothetical protein